MLYDVELSVYKRAELVVQYVAKIHIGFKQNILCLAWKVTNKP